MNKNSSDNSFDIKRKLARYKSQVNIYDQINIKK